MYRLLPCYDVYVDKQRLMKSLSYLRGLSCDIYCLSEVEESDVEAITHFFGEKWRCAYSSHDVGFWREWLEGKEWVSNGTCIVINTDKLKYLGSCTLRLGDGCNASHVLCTSNGTNVSITSVHFDTSDKKWTEARRLLSLLNNSKLEMSIISGDFNFEDVSIFTDAGYREGASEKHSTPILQGRIDHTLALGARAIEGRIHNLGNACATVNINGSDHYATVSTVWI